MIKKLALLQILLALLTVSCPENAAGQYLPPRYSIHVSNPASLLSKGGVKVQYRLNQGHSVLVDYTKYWGFFPGYQAAVEYHHYYRSWEHSEPFFYGKFGVGNAAYGPKPYYSGWNEVHNDPGNYGFIGAGGGKRYNFGPFFLEFNVGLKYTEILDKTENINKNLFYTTGPGALIDMSLHLGFQFFNEERQMFSRTLGAHRPRYYR